jgi:cell division protein FtsN
MAELEIHHEEGHEHDPMGQRVGVMAALLAVFLAVVTILSHRTHTEAIIKKTDSNDQWQYYQASRMKYHNVELGERLIGVLGPDNPGAQDTLRQFGKDKQKYTDQANEQKEKATRQTEESETAERRALHYDLGEGLLEIALVLSSLYFIARKMLFPIVGVIAGVAGLIIAITGLSV